MMKRIHSRFAFLALLVAAVAFVLGACDSNGGGANPEETVVTDSMQLVNVTPDVGTDLETPDTSFTLTFTDPVVENEYTRTDVEPTGGDRHLIDNIELVPPQAKNLSPNHSLPISLSFNEDRTELTVTPEQELRDGFIYRLSVGDADAPSTPEDEGTGLYDPRFKSENGARFAPNPNFPREQFEFSVGQNESAPAAPSISFDAEADYASTDTLADGVLNYTNRSVAIPFQVDEIDDSAAEVKGYEVYYRSQNQAGRSGTGDQFVKATLVDPEADAGDFEDHQGIIPASAVDADGEVDFTVEVWDYPFSEEGGSYGPIEWKVRAVSINNVRGEFSEVITTEDNTAPELDGVANITTNEADEVEVIEVRFSEALDSETVSASAFTVRDDNGDPVGVSDVSLSNELPENGDEATVALTLATPTPESDFAPGNVEVNDSETSSPVTDLAGNGVDPVNDDSDFYYYYQ